MVKAGTLPKVEERLPKNPLVLAPVDEIGKYSSRRWRSLLPDAGWTGHFQESQYGHSALRWIDDGLGIAPGMCESWEANADNTEWTLHFREGLKWSDGEPCTVDDVLFWWNDLDQAHGCHLTPMVSRTSARTPRASWCNSPRWTITPSP